MATWALWTLAVIVTFMAAVLIELLIEDREDRLDRRPWHGRLEDHDTVRLPTNLIGS